MSISNSSHMKAKLKTNFLRLGNFRCVSHNFYEINLTNFCTMNCLGSENVNTSYFCAYCVRRVASIGTKLRDR